mgnify:FL=1
MADGQTPTSSGTQAGSQPNIDRYLSVMGGNSSSQPQDPLFFMKEIFADKELTEEQKLLLFGMSQTRFMNRRKMAFISLYTLLGFFGFLLAGVVIDAFNAENKGVMEVIAENETMFIWIGGFLTSIIALYYGSSTIRPSS